MSTTPVNSYDEWSPLEEIIVGTPYHLDYYNDESFRLFFYDNLREERAFAVPHSPVFRTKPSDRLKEECLEDLDGLIETMEQAGVKVRRPEMLTSVPVVQTPWWSTPMGHAMMPRDNFLVVGDEIIESSPVVRARYFEGDLYKELFTEYFRAGAKWTVAPRSRLMDRNLDYSYVIKMGYTGPLPDDPSYEMMWDAAQCLRFGRDIVFNASTENHRLGVEWLRRHLGSDFNVHMVEVTDNHIDSFLMPLRPGKLLFREGLDINLLPEALRKWDLIQYRHFDKPVEIMEEGIPKLASQSVAMNVLPLDEDRIILQDIQEPLIRDLEKHGFTPIPLRWRHGRSLGGGFHCVTLDIRRRGGLESYF
jgi:glycine amidinotransferase